MCPCARAARKTNRRSRRSGLKRAGFPDFDADVQGVADQRALGDLVADQFALDCAVVHHEHSVTAADELVAIGRVKEDCRPVAGEFAQQLVHLLLRADIDSARRIIQQQDARPSTFESVRRNVGFLREIVGDGRAAAVFSRMLPYGGTPIRDRLQKEGRLRGDLTHPDYEFLDLRLNEYHRLLTQTVRPWIHREGLSYELNYAWDEFETVRRLVPGVEGAEAYQTALQSMTSKSNERLFRLVEDSSLAFEDGDRSKLDVRGVRDYCEKGRKRLLDVRNRFIAKNIELLTETVNPNCATGPVLAPQIH